MRIKRLVLIFSFQACSLMQLQIVWAAHDLKLSIEAPLVQGHPTLFWQNNTLCIPIQFMNRSKSPISIWDLSVFNSKIEDTLRFEVSTPGDKMMFLKGPGQTNWYWNPVNVKTLLPNESTHARICIGTKEWEEASLSPALELVQMRAIYQNADSSFNMPVLPKAKGQPVTFERIKLWTGTTISKQIDVRRSR